MAKRNCAKCGKDKDVDGGRVCENGHFICKQCVYTGGSGILGHSAITSCPLCKKKLN